MSSSLRPRGLQHTRLPCPSPSPGVCPNSCPPCQWCHESSHPLLPLLFLPSIFPSIKVFSNKSAVPITWPKYWSISFSISPPNEYSGLISFRTDWFDLLSVQGTLKSLLQHHSSKHQFFSTYSSLWSNSHIHTCGPMLILGPHKKSIACFCSSPS